MQITNYKPFLREILEKIQLARYEMLKTVSRETVNLYWNIGKLVSDKVKQERWGKSIVEQLSKDLQLEFPGIRGFSARNIWNIKFFYEVYSQNEKLQPLVAEIGWVQNCIIIEKCKDEQERIFNQYKNLPENIARYLPSEDQIVKRLENLFLKYV